MKRSLIITLALIAAIAVPLCASSGWARGLGVLGLTGGDGGTGEPACAGVQGNNVTTQVNYSIAGLDKAVVRYITLACSGTPSTLNYSTKNYGAGNAKIAIYATSGGAPTGAPLYVSGELPFSGSGVTETITDSDCNYELSGGTYAIAILSSINSRVYYSGALSGGGATATGSYSSPGGLTSVVGDNNNYSIWMTF